MYHYDRINDDRLAEKVFSFCVNMGPNKAHVMLQSALIFTGKQIVIDGHLGPKTLEAINSHPNPAWLLAGYKIEAVKQYLKFDRARFERGWLLRAIG